MIGRGGENGNLWCGERSKKTNTKTKGLERN
jgi:hypothetical protein